MAGSLSARVLTRTSRACQKHPGHALLMIVTAAIGIGSGVGMYTYMDTLLFRPLPFRQPERLVRLSGVEPGITNIPLSGPDFEDIQNGAHSFEAVAVYDNYAAFNLLVGGETLHVVGSAASANFFRVLGAQAWKGRTFLPADAESPVVVLSHAFWSTQLGGNPDVLNTTLKLNGRDFIVIGVMPPGFWFPGMQESKVWIPLFKNPVELNAGSMSERANHWLKPVARLKEGATITGATAEIRRISAKQQIENPSTNHNLEWVAQPLREWVNEDVEDTAPGLLALSLLMTGIACANLGILVTLRILSRRAETAMRLALGADRMDLFVEEAGDLFLLSVIGGAAGAALAFVMIKMVPIGLTDATPLFEHLSIDNRILAVFVASVIASSVLAGAGALSAALKRNWTDALRVLASNVRGATGSTKLRIFVACQIALATVLTVGSAALYQGLLKITSIDPGFDARHVITMEMDLPPSRSETSEACIAYVNSILKAVRALPGVQGVGISNFLQFGGLHGNARFMVASGSAAGAVFSGPAAERNVISPGFFAGMGIPLLRGRDFTFADADRVVIVSESLSKRFLPSRDPIGAYLKLEGLDGEYRIVGVVGDTKRISLSEPTPYYMYLPYARYQADEFFLAVRTAGNPLSLAGIVKKTLQTLEKGQTIWNVATMDDRVASSFAGQRFNAAFVAACAALALLLALIGVHGTVAYTVAARTKEIGIRMALGAAARDIIALLVGEIAFYAVGGALAGALGAEGLRSLFRRWSLVPVALGPQLLGLAFAMMVTLAILAALVAILRATRLEPTAALRA